MLTEEERLYIYGTFYKKMGDSCGFYFINIKFKSLYLQKY